MAEDQRVQVVRDLITALVASWPAGYAGVRAVLEELVEALPVQGPHPARMAARDYLARHCQSCGEPVSRLTDDTVDDLGALRAGVADVREVQGGDREVLCSACYVRLVEEDDAGWLAELHQAQQERPLGLFGRTVATVLAENDHQREQNQIRTLEDHLHDLAGQWYTTTNAAEQAVIAQTYARVVDDLYQHGWDGTIQIESELPTEQMPSAYQRRHPQRGTWSVSPLSTPLACESD